MKIIKILLGFTILIIVSMSFFIAHMYKESPRTAYIEINKVYEGFNYTKELNIQIEAQLRKRNMILDSLRFNIQNMSNVLRLEKDNDALAKRIDLSTQQFYQLKQKFDEENSNIKSRYGEMILKQLNQYIKSFGEQENYTYIFGAQGNGAIVFADKDLNITDKVIVFVNKRYNGDEK